LADVWERRGAEVFERLANDDPATLAKLGVSVLPKELFLNIQQATPGNLGADEWALMRKLVELIQRCAPGADASDVLQTIESSLRMAYAEPALPAPPSPPPYSR
jgi:hypothetical protein